MNEFQRALTEGRKPNFKDGKRAKTDVIIETKIRCTICMKKFGKRPKVRIQGKWYHEECAPKVYQRGKKYGGRKQFRGHQPMRAV